MVTLVNLKRFLKRPTYLMERVMFQNVPSFFLQNPSSTNWKNEFQKKLLFFIFEKY
jgi:hypothetical protein